ncbi:MAG: ribonuclease HII [Candidatus Aenigmarchaeota archaeon]|nr:ribonuclease HII [Candidatus Aenigmarchaeota archaeon]
MKKILGIDEAGRGALIGPLVIVGAYADEEKMEKLKEIGVKDSKLLTYNQRIMLYEEIKKILNDWIIIKISASEIDKLRERKNLNKIEAERMAEIIRALKPDKVYVDAPQVTTEKFKMYLKALVKIDTEIISENFADRKYPIVSAASIIAKVERDKEIEKIKEKVNYNFGVGYPHDEKTIKFVKECIKNKKHLEFIRKSWATFIELSGENKQKKLEGFCIKI